MSTKRKNYTPEEKVIILKKHLLEKLPLSDLCDQYGLHPTVFYRWQKTLFENAYLAFVPPKEKHTNRLTKRIAELEQKITRKNEVLSELMEEHVSLKKTLGVI